MAIVATNLAADADSADRSTYTATLSSQPADNTLILAAYCHGSGGAVAEPTVSGCGLTWVAVESTTISSIRRLTVFRAFGTATSSGPVVFVHPGSSSQTRALWNITQFAGVATSGTDGSGAIVQSTCAINTASSVATVPLNTFGSTNNVAYLSAFILSSASITPGAGYTSLGVVQSTAPGSALLAEYMIGNDTGPSATFGSTSWAACGLEILQQVTTGAATPIIRARRLTSLGVS